MFYLLNLQCYLFLFVEFCDYLSDSHFVIILKKNIDLEIYACSADFAPLYGCGRYISGSTVTVALIFICLTPEKYCVFC